MKSRTVKFAFGLAAASFFAFGCARDSGQVGPAKYRLPWPDDNGTYELRDIEIKTFSDPTRLRGQYAQIFVEPSEANGQIAAEEPVGRFVEADGVQVPADFVSMEAATIYAHLERLRELDDAIGVSSVLRWPMKIGIQTNVMDQGQGIKNNAVYDGRLDALLIVPYTGSELPIALNAGVLGHEHFHTIFHSFILSKVKEKAVIVGKPGQFDTVLDGTCNWVAGHDDGRHRGEIRRTTVDDEDVIKAANEIPKPVYNGFLLRALNEGLADFFGWVYSGNVDYITQSLPADGRERRLDFDSGKLQSDSAIRNSLIDLERADKLRHPETRVKQAYFLGSQYARFFRQLAVDVSGEERPSREARIAAARKIIEVLPVLASTVVSEFDNSYISPNFILKPLTLLLGDKPSPAVCERIERFKASDKAVELPSACGKKADEKPPEKNENAPVVAGAKP